VGTLAGSPINPSDAFVLWIALFVMLIVACERARARSLGHDSAGACLFIGDDDAARRFSAPSSARPWRQGQSGRAGGVNQALPGVTATPSPADLAECATSFEEWTCTASLWRAHTLAASETIDMIRALKLAGIRERGALPLRCDRVLVEFDDLHGITVLGVRASS
jgi:hypothetical protein